MSLTRARRPARGLDIPLRETARQFPYWHRDEPVLAVTRLDPEYADLRGRFPETWQYLVRAKTLLDSVTMLDLPGVVPDDDKHFERISPLLTAAAEMLSRFAEAEPAMPARAVAEHARLAAEGLAGYSDSREWKTINLFEPGRDEPWLYCGPISTWSARDVRTPMTLLVTVPSPTLQAEVDEVDARIDEVRAAAARLLGDEVKSIKAHPSMRVTDLLLAGGESVSGHKNFAHFFPLEAPESTVPGSEFTVVFANVHRMRLQRCSLELLKEVRGPVGDARPGDVLRMSLRWFRCHDLGHFWRRTYVTGEGQAAEGLNPFERMVLEEAYADILGLLTAEALGGSEMLDTAFTAELIRYLSRRHECFADSAAALLTLGWIRQRTTVFPAQAGLLREAASTLEELVHALHSVLWDADPAEIGRMRAALATGLEYADVIATHFCSLPTDLSYAIS